MRQTSTERPQAVAVSAGIKEWYLTVNTDIRETENGYEYLSKSVTLDHYPTMADVKNAVWECINDRTDEKILTGFVWNGKPVWLSAENQRNFSEGQRMAKGDPTILPIIYKIGEAEDHTPVYHTFTTFEELDGFYKQVFSYINQCLNDGWAEKDNVDWTEYAP